MKIHKMFENILSKIFSMYYENMQFISRKHN